MKRSLKKNKKLYSLRKKSKINRLKGGASVAAAATSPSEVPSVRTVHIVQAEMAESEREIERLSALIAASRAERAQIASQRPSATLQEETLAANINLVKNQILYHQAQLNLFELQLNTLHDSQGVKPPNYNNIVPQYTGDNPNATTNPNHRGNPFFNNNPHRGNPFFYNNSNNS